jgi:superfamily II DNA helicase RecQ
MNKEAESKALDPNSDIRVINVTPEWTEKQIKVQKLACDGALPLLAVDEAHIVSNWSDFTLSWKT